MGTWPSIETSGSALESLRWYHTIDLPGGVATPGEYDLRPIAERLPFPSLEGKRCLDVGSRDGFYAFEMERRGALEVVSLDIDEPDDIDLPGPPADRDQIRAELEDGHLAFAAARQALNSDVERRLQSAYHLQPEEVGTFDFAVVGTLLHHLRDPVGALTGVRRVLNGTLLVNDAVLVGLSTLSPVPRAMPMMQNGPYWWSVNRAGLKRMVEAADLAVAEVSWPYLVPYGAGRTSTSWRSCFQRPFNLIPARVVLRRGAPHVWILATTRSA